MLTSLLDRNAAESVQLYKFRGNRIFHCKAGQGFIERQQLIRISLTRVGLIDQWDALLIAAALVASFAAGTVNQYVPHCKRCRREEVCPTLPVSLRIVANQAEIGFMDERRGLQGLSGLFLIEVTRSKSTQFLINERQQLLRGGRFATADGIQELRHFVHSWIGGEFLVCRRDAELRRYRHWRPAICGQATVPSYSTLYLHGHSPRRGSGKTCVFTEYPTRCGGPDCKIPRH